MHNDCNIGIIHGYLCIISIKVARQKFGLALELSLGDHSLKRLIWYGNNDLRIERIPNGSLALGKHDVLVRIRAVGICGTDIHILNGSFPLSRPPLVLGHEISGEVLFVGSQVIRVREGDRVTVDSVVGCGHCSACLSGNRQFCPNGFEFGITRDGGCQEFLMVPESNVYPIGQTISFEEAAILDMEVWAAVRKCGIMPDDSVLVLGAGPMGLVASQVVRIQGAGRVTLSEIEKRRVKTAESLGVADEYLTNDGPESRPRERCFDVAIDCAGTPESTRQALYAVRPGGRVLLYGVYEQNAEQVDLNQIVLKDLVVFGALSNRSGWEEVIQLVATGALNLNRLVTHRFPLEEGPRAYDMVRRKDDGVIKAVLLV